MKNIILYFYLLVYNILIGISHFILSLIYYKSIKVYISNHFTIGLLKLIRLNTIFPHPIGIVIGNNVKIGRNCVIYQNVTIGSKNDKYPKIGDNVIIYPNSIILGGITVGDNVIIGANSFVTVDIDANTVVAGNPLKIIKK